MSKLCPLFSGSKGNSYYISCSGNSILVDAGLSAKQLQETILNNNLSLDNIRAIFITHEHIDHISALRVFASRYNINVYSSKGTLQALRDNNVLNGKFNFFEMDDKPVDIESMQVSMFHTSHDCTESVGFNVITSDDTKVSIATDLGFVSDEVRKAISCSDVVVIESNHDVNMLKNGDYPYELKRRILSNVGHLNNDDCAVELHSLVESGTKHILLGHLSRENNIPDLALQTSICELQKYGAVINQDYTLDVAPVKNTNNKIIFF